MTIEFTLPVGLDGNPDLAICTCMDCGAAVLINDSELPPDGRDVHREWHERVQAMPANLYAFIKANPEWKEK